MNYLQVTADRIRQLIPPEVLPADAEPLLLTYAVLARSKGRRATAEDVHDAWTAWMLLRGEHHDAMRPFAELDRRVQDEDQPFLRAIHEAADELEAQHRAAELG
jgi:hypothetical protein